MRRRRARPPPIEANLPDNRWTRQPGTRRGTSDNEKKRQQRPARELKTGASVRDLTPPSGASVAPGGQPTLAHCDSANQEDYLHPSLKGGDSTGPEALLLSGWWKSHRRATTQARTISAGTQSGEESGVGGPGDRARPGTAAGGVLQRAETRDSDDDRAARGWVGNRWEYV